MLFLVEYVQCCLILLLFFPRSSSSATLALSHQNRIPPSQFISFMQKFGYLNGTISSVGGGNIDASPQSLIHEKTLTNAIKLVQRFGGLQETGIFDNATLKLMTSPRCGVRDIPKFNKRRSARLRKSYKRRDKRYILGSYGWRKRTITYFIANWSPKLEAISIESDLKKAFQIWAPYGRIRFIRTYTPSADIIIGFASGYHGDREPFDGPGNTLAHAFYPQEMNSLSGDIHFDNDENWVSTINKNSGPNDSGVLFLMVAAHEIGHSLGLAHSTVYGSIMFPYYKAGERTTSQLDYDDILAMHKLYIASNIAGSDDAEDNIKESVDKPMKPPFVTDMPIITTTISSAGLTTKSTPIDSGVHTTETVLQWFGGNKTKLTFHGDFETIDAHKLRLQQQTDQATIPDICTGNFDTVTVIRNELFIIKGNYLWRLTNNYQIQYGYPIQIQYQFHNFPINQIKNIDAIYERPIDNKLIIFSGKQYWTYDGYNFNAEPSNITDYGLAQFIPKVDAIFIWSRTGHTYLFSGDQFWCYNENDNKLMVGYPRHISRWGGIPSDLDAVISLANGKAYFFKNNSFWLLNNQWVRPEIGYPRQAAQTWLNCL